MRQIAGNWLKVLIAGISLLVLSVQTLRVTRSFALQRAREGTSKLFLSVVAHTTFWLAIAVTEATTIPRLYCFVQSLPTDRFQRFECMSAWYNVLSRFCSEAAILLFLVGCNAFLVTLMRAHVLATQLPDSVKLERRFLVGLRVVFALLFVTQSAALVAMPGIASTNVDDAMLTLGFVGVGVTLLLNAVAFLLYGFALAREILRYAQDEHVRQVPLHSLCAFTVWLRSLKLFGVLRCSSSFWAALVACS